MARFSPEHYRAHSKEDFDAIVTGELTHFALYLEDALNGIISDFFCKEARTDLFERILMRRDGLTFQDKIEIVTALSSSFSESISGQLRSLLKKIEDFKSQRNAFAHGRDATPDDWSGPHIQVLVVNRAGKEKLIEISPERHVENLIEADQLLQSANMIRGMLKSKA